MQRILSLLFLGFILMTGCAQECITHIVQRGESLDYLVNKYGVAEWDIREHNKDLDLDMFYVGLSLQIPLPTNMNNAEGSAKFVELQNANNGLLAEAEQLFIAGKYRKAAKVYTQAINADPKADYYYLRGECYLKQGKYKLALRDLEMAHDNNELSENLRENCSSMLKEAQALRELQLEKRAETWAGIAGLVLATGSAVLQATTESSGTSTYGTANSSVGTSSSYTSSYDSETTSSSVSSSSNSKRRCSCKGGWYDCCSKVATYGLDSYHDCSNCGKSHKMGSHSCKCQKCGGTGYL